MASTITIGVVANVVRTKHWGLDAHVRRRLITYLVQQDSPVRVLA